MAKSAKYVLCESYLAVGEGDVCCATVLELAEEACYCVLLIILINEVKELVIKITAKIK